MAKCCFPFHCHFKYSKRLDAELIRRGHDIRHKRYPIGYQGMYFIYTLNYVEEAPIH